MYNFSTDCKTTATASAAATQNQLAPATDPGQKSYFQSASNQNMLFVSHSYVTYLK
jgi:hypothetical protein